jgi:beta-glucosidase
VFINPGEQQLVQLTIDERALSFFDSDRQQWVAESGDFVASIGISAGDIVARVPFKLR